MGRPNTPGFAIGAKINKWTVVAPTRQVRVGGSRDAYVCRCECGSETVLSKSRLKTQAPMQCHSCAAKEIRRAGGAWGQTQLPEYHAWATMKSRCLNSTHAMYKNYGARGITVSTRWLSFKNFYADMGPRPSPKHSLERKDNNGGYSKANCEWATHKKQSRNKRNSRLLTVDGHTRTVAEWAEQLCTSSTVVVSRIEKHGWSIKDACTIPVLRRKAYKKRNKEA